MTLLRFFCHFSVNIPSIFLISLWSDKRVYRRLTIYFLFVSNKLSWSCGSNGRARCRLFFLLKCRSQNTDKKIWLMTQKVREMLSKYISQESDILPCAYLFQCWVISDKSEEKSPFGVLVNSWFMLEFYSNFQGLFKRPNTSN